MANHELNHKIAGQVHVIEQAFAKAAEAAGEGEEKVTVRTQAAADGGVDYMYQPGWILVRDEDVERVWEFIRTQDDQRIRREWADQTRRVTRGLLRLSLAQTQYSGEGGVLAACDAIDDQLGVGVATPNHVFTVAPVGPCPATEPEEVDDGIEPDPGVCPGHDGEGVSVYVADTGLLAGAGQAHPWLAGVHGDTDPLNPADIDEYTGHGTFAAGVARCMAPKAHMYVANIFKIAGSELESNVGPRLIAALGRGVDIFHLAITASTRKDLAPIGFEHFRQQLRQHKGVVCVVAAGNSGMRKPFWPAAFPEMVSVGALAGDWRSRATFSNHGGWVDVYAPGRDLVNAYAVGTYTCKHDPHVGQIRQFYGMARWSGTSFSTPIVTGLIAARMSRTGENGQEAAAALLEKARAQAIPGVGAILLPCEHGDECGDRGRCSDHGHPHPCCHEHHRPCRHEHHHRADCDHGAHHGHKHECGRC